MIRSKEQFLEQRMFEEEMEIRDERRRRLNRVSIVPKTRSYDTQEYFDKSTEEARGVQDDLLNDKGNDV